MYRWFCNQKYRNDIPSLIECIEEGISALQKECGISLFDLELKNTAPLLMRTKNQDKTMTIGDIAVQIREVGWCNIRPCCKKKKKLLSSWVKFETMDHFREEEAKIGKFIQRDLQEKADATGIPQFAYTIDGTRYDAKPR